MKKIELTQQEIDIIEKCNNGEIDAPTGEIGEIVGDLLERALAYEKEVKPEQEPEDLLQWYYEQYKAQFRRVNPKHHFARIVDNIFKTRI